MAEPGRSPTNTDLQLQIALIQRDIKDLIEEMANHREDAKIRTEAIAQIRMTLNAMDTEDKTRVAAAKASLKTISIGGMVIGIIWTVLWNVGSVVTDLVKSWVAP